MTDLCTIGGRVGFALRASGKGQTWLANKVGVTQGAIWAILSGDTKRSKYLPDVADALGVPLAWLRFGGPTPTIAPAETMIIDLSALRAGEREAILTIYRAMLKVKQ